MIAAKTNLRCTGERRRTRTVVADAGYWSIDDVNVGGVEAIIVPGRHRQLKEIGKHDQQRFQLLGRVEDREINTDQAAVELGVTRARVNQLLRIRRAGVPETLTPR